MKRICPNNVSERLCEETRGECVWTDEATSLIMKRIYKQIASSPARGGIIAMTKSIVFFGQSPNNQ